MVAVLWLLLFAEVIGCVRKPLWIICVREKQCDQKLWEYDDNNQKYSPLGYMLLAGWIVADFAFYTAAFVYFLAMLRRFRIFQSALRFPRWIIPALQGFFGILYLVGLAGDFLHQVVTDHKQEILLRVMSGAFFLCLAAADITISALMVHTFLRVRSQLDFSPSSAGNTTSLSSPFKSTPTLITSPGFAPYKSHEDATTYSIGTGSVLFQPPADSYSFQLASPVEAGVGSTAMAGGGGGSGVGGKTSGGRRHRGGKEKSSSSTIRKLRLMLIVLVLANMMVIILYVGVGALVPNNSTEITQISEAWTCFHAMLGLVFLSEFKQSMAGPRSGASSY